MAQREWKHFTKKYKNVKVEVDMELEVPYTPVFKIQFRLEPSELARTEFQSDYDYQKYLADHKLGKKILRRNVEFLLPINWEWHDAFYGDEATTRVFLLNSTKTYFEIAVFLIADRKYNDIKDWRNIKKECEAIADRLSGLDNFKADKYITFTPAA